MIGTPRILRRRVMAAGALLALALGIGLARPAAAVPTLMNYQGFLTDNANSPVTGSYPMTFKLYPDSTTGAALWSESYATVFVNAGVFNVLLGLATPLPPSVFTGAKLWLQTTVNGTDILPRRPITSVAYAFRSAIADSAVNASPSAGEIAGSVALTCGGSTSGVLVYIPGRSFVAYTGAGGAFDLGAVPAGTYTLHFESPSGTADVASVVVSAGAVTSLGTVSIGPNTQTDVNNCGSCGIVCSANNDTPACVSGTCQIACNTGFGNCDQNPMNGCETNLMSDPANCGGCSNLCSAANATSTCSGGSCAFVCFSGFGNCDNDASNGCETNLSVNNSNCGACGNACGAGFVCVSGKCVAQ